MFGLVEALRRTAVAWGDGEERGIYYLLVGCECEDYLQGFV